MKAVLHTDGASLGNPGPSGIGVVIESGGRTVELSEHIGQATNNIAEYTALVRGLEEAQKLGATEVAVYMDSELVVRQMKGLYRVRDQGLRPLYLRASSLFGSFARRSISHVPREETTAADRLSKEGAEARPKHPPKKPGHGSMPKGGAEEARSQDTRRQPGLPF
jgi:ribonuclease HI